MKKLIAMLLAIALVASFGVTSAFAGITNADSAKLYERVIATDKERQSFFGAKSSLASDVAALWQQFDLDMSDPTMSASDKQAKYTEFAAELKALEVENSVNGYGLAAALFDPTADRFTTWQDAKDAARAAGAAKAQTTTWEAYDTYWKNFYTAQAAKDKARGEDSAAKTKALNTYLASDRSAMDRAIYDVAVANVEAQRALTNAKQAVADAKAEFAQAQNTWKDTVNVKVAQAQAEYYVAVADAYSAAVSDAVAAIYDALG